jgi:hypothetical protein
MPNSRNTIAYFKKETSVGDAVTPSSATDGFCGIEKPDITTGQKEVLESEILSGNIGVKKGQLGFESAMASIVTELRSHGDTSSPTEPDFGVLFESGIGTPNTSTADAVQAAPAPSTTEFGIETEGNLQKNDFFIIDNTTDGRIARFVDSFKVDIVAGVNDDIDFTDDDGTVAATITAGTYTHGGSETVGSIGEAIKTAMEAANTDETITVTATEESDGSYTYTIACTGTVFEILIDSGANAATNWCELNGGFGSSDLTGATSYEASSAIWGNRVVCNLAMDSAPTAGDVVSASVNYKPIETGHEHFTSGFYVGNAADGYLEQVIACLVSSLSIQVEAGAIAKISAEVQGLKGDRTATTASSYTPSLESVQGLVGFSVECYLSGTILRANTFNLNVENEITEQTDFYESSGKSGSIVRKRSISGSVNPYSSGATTLYDALMDQTDKEIMLVIGKKDTGGFIVGQTVGILLPQVNFSQVKTGDVEDNVIEDCQFNANTGVSGTERDIVFSFA